MKWKRIKVLTIKQVRALHEPQKKGFGSFNFHGQLQHNIAELKLFEPPTQGQDFTKEKITKIKVEKN